MNQTIFQPNKEIMDFRAYEAAPGISAIVLPDAPIYTHVAVSNDFIRASGMKKADVIGKGHFAVFPKSPDDPNFTGELNLRASFEYIIQHKEPHEIPVQRYDIPNEDGTFSQKYWKINNAPILSDKGEVLYIVHTAADITDQVLAAQREERIKELEKSHYLFMQAPVVIGIVKGDDYIIELANEGLLQVWARENDVIGKPLFEAIPELQDQGFKELLDHVRHTGEPFFAFEHPIKLVRNGKEEVLYFDFVYKPFYEEGQDKASGVFAVGHDITRQVDARQKFKNIIEQATNPILILKGEDMVLEVANEALFKLWKVDESSIGKTFLEILPEMKGQGFLELLQQVYHTGKPFQGYEVPAVFEEDDDEKRTVYFNFTYQPYREAHGSITGVLVLATDVTGQVLAKRQAAESQEALKRFKFMADNAQDPFILMREDGTFAYLNKKTLEAWGYTEEEAKNIRVPDVDPIYNDPAFKELFYKAQKETIPQFETLHKRKDGHVFHVEVKVNGISLDGQPHLFAIARDISERKKQEETFEAQNILIRTITNNATSALFMMNAKGYCTFMNAAGEKMFGYTQEEIRSKPLHYLIHHHRPDGSYYPMEECPLDRALPDNFDVRAHRDLFFRKDGSSFPITCAASPIFENGVPVATVIEVRDISLEMEAEQALRRSASELEGLVGERTKDLHLVNEQLQQFTYAASHDLQEPLRKITLFLGRLLNNLGPTLSEENKHLSDRIEHTTRRMQSLITDLLDYSNTTLGVTDFEEVELGVIVNEVLDDMEAAVIESGAAVNIQQLPKVKGDHRQLRQLFQNLLSNALKYSKKEVTPQIQITSKLVTGAEADGYVSWERKNDPFYLVEVKDNGIGFDPNDADRIFRLFQRLHGKAEYEGTGVGLGIVQKVVENHKGLVWAESTPGEGSTFKVLLPAE